MDIFNSAHSSAALVACS